MSKKLLKVTILVLALVLVLSLSLALFGCDKPDTEGKKPEEGTKPAKTKLGYDEAGNLILDSKDSKYVNSVVEGQFVDEFVKGLGVALAPSINEWAKEVEDGAFGFEIVGTDNKNDGKISLSAQIDTKDNSKIDLAFDVVGADDKTAFGFYYDGSQEAFGVDFGNDKKYYIDEANVLEIGTGVADLVKEISALVSGAESALVAASEEDFDFAAFYTETIEGLLSTAATMTATPVALDATGKATNRFVTKTADGTRYSLVVDFKTVVPLLTTLATAVVDLESINSALNSIFGQQFDIGTMTACDGFIAIDFYVDNEGELALGFRVDIPEGTFDFGQDVVDANGTVITDYYDFEIAEAINYECKAEIDIVATQTVPALDLTKFEFFSPLNVNFRGELDYKNDFTDTDLTWTATLQSECNPFNIFKSKAYLLVTSTDNITVETTNVVGLYYTYELVEEKPSGIWYLELDLPIEDNAIVDAVNGKYSLKATELNDLITAVAGVIPGMEGVTDIEGLIGFAIDALTAPKEPEAPAAPAEEDAGFSIDAIMGIVDAIVAIYETNNGTEITTNFDVNPYTITVTGKIINDVLATLVDAGLFEKAPYTFEAATIYKLEVNLDEEEGTMAAKLYEGATILATLDWADNKLTFKNEKIADFVIDASVEFKFDANNNLTNILVAFDTDPLAFNVDVKFEAKKITCTFNGTKGFGGETDTFSFVAYASYDNVTDIDKDGDADFSVTASYTQGENEFKVTAKIITAEMGAKGYAEEIDEADLGLDGYNSLTGAIGDIITKILG